MEGQTFVVVSVLLSFPFLIESPNFNEDVPIAGAADRAEAADQRRRGSFEETWSSLRDCLLQEQGPFMALWRVSSLKLYRFLSFNYRIFSSLMGYYD